MTSRIPPAPDLLEAAADYLESGVLPALDGYHRFQTRITVNVLRTVMRELRLAPIHAAAEHQRLTALLGHDGELTALQTELAEALLNGSVPLDDPTLTAHLRQSVLEALQIDNPKWASSQARDV